MKIIVEGRTYRLMNDLLFICITIGMLTGIIGSSCLWIGISILDPVTIFWGCVNLATAIWLIASVVPRLDDLKNKMEADNG